MTGHGRELAAVWRTSDRLAYVIVTVSRPHSTVIVACTNVCGHGGGMVWNARVRCADRDLVVSCIILHDSTSGVGITGENGVDFLITE